MYWLQLHCPSVGAGSHSRPMMWRLSSSFYLVGLRARVASPHPGIAIRDAVCPCRLDRCVAGQRCMECVRGSRALTAVGYMYGSCCSLAGVTFFMCSSLWASRWWRKTIAASSDLFISLLLPLHPITPIYPRFYHQPERCARHASPPALHRASPKLALSSQRPGRWMRLS
jgi:hypothetical protein